MRSRTLPSFWKAYATQDKSIKRQSHRAFLIWRDNPFHPSLRFKCVNAQENIWSVRITRGFRALGVLEDDVVTWYWIGNHDEYRRHFGD